MTCQIDGCNNPAPFGYRRPGAYSKLTKRGYLWVCRDHREAAEERRRAARWKA